MIKIRLVMMLKSSAKYTYNDGNFNISPLTLGVAGRCYLAALRYERGRAAEK